MKKLFLIFSMIIVVSGCSTVKKYWPRLHDPVMLNHLITVSMELDAVNCKVPDWTKVANATDRLNRYVILRNDPQQDNINGLNKHIKTLKNNSNPTFCELGKNGAKRRIDAAGHAWGDR